MAYAEAEEAIIYSTANVNLIILCLLCLSEHQAKRGVATDRNGSLAAVRNSTTSTVSASPKCSVCRIANWSKRPPPGFCYWSRAARESLLALPGVVVLRPHPSAARVWGSLWRMREGSPPIPARPGARAVPRAGSPVLS